MPFSAAWHLQCLLVMQFLLAASGVPHFEVDLDSPPATRFVAITKHYEAEIRAMQKHMSSMVTNIRFKGLLGSNAKKEWIELVEQHYDHEQRAEVDGIADALGYHKGDLKRAELRLMALLYE